MPSSAPSPLVAMRYKSLLPRISRRSKCSRGSRMASRGRSNLVSVNGGRGVGGLDNARLGVAVGEGSGLKHNPGSSTYWTEAERAIFEEGVIEFASEPSIDQYATIAKKLPNKTIRDVAVRYQSLTVKFYPEALRQMPTLQLYRFMLMLLNSLPTPSSKQFCGLCMYHDVRRHFR